MASYAEIKAKLQQEGKIRPDFLSSRARKNCRRTYSRKARRYASVHPTMSTTCKPQRSGISVGYILTSKESSLPFLMVASEPPDKPHGLKRKV